ncbi:MAG: hypothetical protein ACE5GA_08955, partial [Candidatus Zixiibacteriota bacterium]
MTDSSSGTPRSPLWNWLAGAIVLLAALRFVGLENDPPLYLVGHGQDQLTDPYHLTFHARNEILYGEWNPFAYHRWDVFKHSLVSAAAYVAFALGEPSRFWANLASTALNLAGLALFLTALLALRGRRETLIAALLLLINSTLFFYARLPFLENGLIFLSGLTFFVLVRFNDKNWGLALTGALVALCGLIGKLFGFLLLGPVLLTLLYLHRRGCVKPALITLAGVAAGTIAVLALFYGGSLPTLVAYYSEQTVGMYGKPPGLASVGGFMTMFATYGGESGLAEFAPMLVLMPLVSVIVIALTTPEVFQRQREFVPLVFALIWLAVGVLGLMPFFYRPMRYSL